MSPFYSDLQPLAGVPLDSLFGSVTNILSEPLKHVTMAFKINDANWKIINWNRTEGVSFTWQTGVTQRVHLGVVGLSRDWGWSISNFFNHRKNSNYLALLKQLSDCIQLTQNSEIKFREISIFMHTISSFSTDNFISMVNFKKCIYLNVKTNKSQYRRKKIMLISIVHQSILNVF